MFLSWRYGDTCLLPEILIQIIIKKYVYITLIFEDKCILSIKYTPLLIPCL
jgi:hypothetical protein